MKLVSQRTTPPMPPMKHQCRTNMHTCDISDMAWRAVPFTTFPPLRDPPPTQGVWAPGGRTPSATRTAWARHLGWR